MNFDLLDDLEQLLNTLSVEGSVLVFGGLAIDGHRGLFTRDHADIDLLCWRKDIKHLRDALQKIGLESKLFAHPKYPSLLYKLNTIDKDKTFGAQIIDRAPGNQFEISFWHHPKQTFDTSLLKSKPVTLDGVTFPVVSKELLKIFKEQECDTYENTMKNDPEKFETQKLRYQNCVNDIQILKERY